VVARPVVKWAGGKSRLVPRLVDLMPPGPIETYAEPFMGGAAMFFHLAAQPKRRFARAVLSDMNADLVAVYQSIQSRLDALIDRVRTLRDEHMRREGKRRSDHYYEIRDQNASKMKPIDRAARLLFLNKTCFNGLWRVNAAGKFNVPYGRYEKPKILDVDVLRAAHDALDGVRIVLGDYTKVTRDLGAGDFAYFDPPYVPVSKTSSFTSYAKDGFGPKEQEELAAELRRLQSAGVAAMLSNAYSPETRALYRGLRQTTVPAARAINSDPKKRGDVDEIVVMTYPLPAQPSRAAS
jgi:DNA adenine methylase